MSLNHFSDPTLKFKVAHLVTTDDANIKLNGPNIEIGGTCMPDSLGTEGQVLTVDTNTNCSKWEDLPAAIPETNIPDQVLTSTITEGEPVWAPLDISSVQNITATPNITNITGQTNTEQLQFKAQDGQPINLNSLPNLGNVGEFLATSANGSLFWKPDGSGPSGLQQTEVPLPTTAINKVPLYNSNDGLTVKSSNLEYTGLGWNYSGENINNVQSVQTSALSTVAPATDIAIQSDLNVGTSQILSDTTIGLNSGTSTDIKINSNSKLEITDLQTIIKNDLKVDNILENTLNNGVNIDGIKIENVRIINKADTTSNLHLDFEAVKLNSGGYIELNTGATYATDIKNNGNTLISVTDIETIMNNDLKVDNIVKNVSDNINVEGSQFRTGGLATINELTVLDAIDVGGNVISSVADGVIATDAVNKQQLDTKLDSTETAELINRNGTVIMIQDLDLNGNKITNLSNALTAGDALNKGQGDTDYLRVDGGNNMISSLNVNNNKIINLSEPVLTSDATTKNYVDDYVDNVSTTNLKVDGSLSMQGDLNMNANNIENITTASFGLNGISIMGGNINDVNEMQSDNIVERTLNAGVNVEDININNSLINSTSPANPLLLGNNTSKIEINETTQEVKLVQCNLNMNANNINNCSNASIAMSLDMQNTGFINNLIDPITALQGANKRYVDNQDALKINLTEKGDINGVCPLVNSLIPNQYLPDLAITDVYVVLDNTERDQLLVQRGDVAIVENDPIEGANNYIWAGPIVSVLPQPDPITNWKQLVVPQGTVLSVNLKSGIVSLNTDDIPETVDNPYFTDLRKAELINRNGSVAMLQNLDIGLNKIVNIQDNPTIGTDATNKNYVDTQNTFQVSKSGDSMSGTLDMVNQKITTTYIPVADADLTNKLYVDTQDDLKLDKTGGTITGTLLVNDTLTLNNNLQMNGQNLDNAFSVDTQSLINSNNPSIIVGTNLSLQANKATTTYIPVANEDLTNKLYVDTQDDLKLDKTGGTITGNLIMSDNNIVNVGNVECDTISSATATSINVNHDLIMAIGKFIYTSGLFGPTGASSQIFVGSDLLMGTKKVIAGPFTFDSTGLSSTGTLDLTAPTQIDINSEKFEPNPSGTVFTMQPIAGKDMRLTTNGGNSFYQSTGATSDTYITSGRNVIINGTSNISTAAPVHFIGNGLGTTQLRVNNLVQDTNKDIFARRCKFNPSIPIPIVGPGLSTYGPGASRILEGAVNTLNFGTVANPSNQCGVLCPLAGFYKIDFSCDVSCTAANGLYQFELRVGGQIVKTCTFNGVKDVITTTALNTIESVSLNQNIEMFIRVDIGPIVQVYNYNMTVHRLRENI